MKRAKWNFDLIICWLQVKISVSTNVVLCSTSVLKNELRVRAIEILFSPFTLRTHWNDAIFHEIDLFFSLMELMKPEIRSIFASYLYWRHDGLEFHSDAGRKVRKLGYFWSFSLSIFFNFPSILAEIFITTRSRLISILIQFLDQNSRKHH